MIRRGLRRGPLRAGALAGLAWAGTLAGLGVASPPPAAAASQSNNWSGYQQAGATYHEVSAEWVVPAATPHQAGSAAYSAAWVGIGGGCVTAGCNLPVTDQTLIQAGTEQDVDASGHATYSAWYELIPAPSITVSQVTVNPGDLVRVDINEGSTETWTIAFQDLTNGSSFTNTTSYSSSHLTAEWILESPVAAGTGGVSAAGPLPNLPVMQFDHATVNGGPADLAPGQEVQLADTSGAPIATPSAPDGEADGFADCVYASSCPAPTTELPTSGGGSGSGGGGGSGGATGGCTATLPSAVSMSRTPDGGGYWEAGGAGGIAPKGDAACHGSLAGVALSQPIVGMAATPGGGGYWLVARDGGIFTFGDAHFYGSTGAIHLAAPIVGMARSADGGGYWLVASDGGIFTFGDAHFYGSTGAIHLNQPIVGMAATPDSGGYWLVASDGGIFTFGDAHFFGSAAG